MKKVLILLMITIMGMSYTTVQATQNIEVDTSLYTTINANGRTNFAITNDGSLWAWGENKYGQLGDGTKENRLTPVKIMEDAVSVSAGPSSGFAIKKDNSLWAWGVQFLGEKGTEEYLKPVKIMDDVIGISEGQGHDLILKKDKSLWGYGYNDFGQLGELQGERFSTSQKIANNVKEAVAGGNHSVILKTDGSVWTFGNNEKGALGDGTRTDNDTPNKVLDGMKKVYAGNASSFALSEDNTLWFWGSTYGDMIGGYQIHHFTPFPYIKDAKSVASQYEYNLVVKQDGTLWIYGNTDEPQRLSMFGYKLDLPLKISDDVSCVSGWSNLKYQALVLKNNGELFRLELPYGKEYAGEKAYTFTKIMDDVRIPSEPVAVEEKHFTDIQDKSEEMHKAIEALSRAEIVKGTDGTKFSPDASITRAEIAAILLRMTGKEEEKDNGGFSDVSENQWYYGVAGASKKHNIVQGFDDNTFRGDEVISKAQFVSMVARTLSREKAEISAYDSSMLKGVLNYTDNETIPEWAKKEIELANKFGLIEGTGAFHPDTLVNRGDAAVVLYQLYGRI